MQTYKVKLLKHGKKPELIDVATVQADRFEVTRLHGRDHAEGLFPSYIEGLVFFKEGTFSDKLIAFYPGSDWIVEVITQSNAGGTTHFSGDGCKTHN